VPGPTVLQVCQPPDGGVAEHVVHLSRALVGRGWAVEALVDRGTPVSVALAAAGARVHEVRFPRAPAAADLAAAERLWALDRRSRYAIVHAHSSKAGALTRAVLPRRRRLVYTPHCFAFAATVGRLETFAYRAIEQALTPRSGAIVAVCGWERKLAERSLAGAAARLRVIPNGVPACPAADPAPELLEFKGDRPLAGLVSVLRPQKDPLLALRALARIAANGPPPGRLAIVGHGQLRSAVRSEIGRLGLEAHARWFGFTGGVGRYLRALDLLVLSSAWEALPLSVLEAMSCGLPVVATRVGGVPEAIADGVSGRLVPSRDAEALADALGDLLRSPERRAAMGAAGQAAWRRGFRLEPMVDSVEGLYRELLAA
jgi:glycosyltransferase involved in cell wall biosynthesis